MPPETIHYFYPEVLEEFLKTNPDFEDIVVKREIQVDELTRANDPSSDSASRNNTNPGSPVEAMSTDSDLIDLNASTEQFTIVADHAVVDLTSEDDEHKKKRGRGRPRSMSNSRASNGSTPAATSSVNGHDSPPRNRKKRGPNAKSRTEELSSRFSGTITDPKIMLEYLKQTPANEVFASSHVDSNYPSTLARKCVVEHVTRVPDNKVFVKQPSHYFYCKFFDQTTCELRDVEEHPKSSAVEMARVAYDTANMITYKPAATTETTEVAETTETTTTETVQVVQRFTTTGEAVSDVDSDEILNTPQDNRAKSGPPVKRRKLDNNRESVQPAKSAASDVHSQPNGNHNVNTTTTTTTTASAANANTTRALKSSVNNDKSESSEGEPVKKAVGPSTGRGRKRKVAELNNPEYMESLRIEINNTNVSSNTNVVPIKQPTHTATIDLILDDDYQGSSEVHMLERAVEKVHEAVDLSRQALEAFKKQITVRIRALDELS